MQPSSQRPRPLPPEFFDKPSLQLAVALLGKVVMRRVQGEWLGCRIIETEAYYLNEKASHSSLGRTPAREAMFMPAGTIYMYYSRGKPSLNVSAHGAGNAVLIKSGVAWRTDPQALALMREGLGRDKPADKICSGQTLLAEALHLQVEDWRGKKFDPEQFYIGDDGHQPEQIIQTTRLGIAPQRDAHLPYRFVDAAFARQATQNPIRRTTVEGQDYGVLSYDEALKVETQHG
ncbi:DNA-3-methyladenine glycosylase [Sulfurivirga caldicuralii]|uniref:Putative 3-methyladenine DNA glycosylase n=1 Tax=Sulfurivirga caldicuralii TaxID=364032 RepID=A0A1N6GD91_9GAMM|nr:DNA-3-methyladenine glycosylase [Sulfurivirga caldicuralii]SIO05508.1 DNA-3-methyladenine glycosylase [Sulfurivirga caldicuralii]